MELLNIVKNTCAEIITFPFDFIHKLAFVIIFSLNKVWVTLSEGLVKFVNNVCNWMERFFQMVFDFFKECLVKLLSNLLLLDAV